MSLDATTPVSQGQYHLWSLAALEQLAIAISQAGSRSAPLGMSVAGLAFRICEEDQVCCPYMLAETTGREQPVDYR